MTVISITGQCGEISEEPPTESCMIATRSKWSNGFVLAALIKDHLVHYGHGRSEGDGKSLACAAQAKLPQAPRIQVRRWLTLFAAWKCLILTWNQRFPSLQIRQFQSIRRLKLTDLSLIWYIIFFCDLQIPISSNLKHEFDLILVFCNICMYEGMCWRIYMDLEITIQKCITLHQIIKQINVFFSISQV